MSDSFTSFIMTTLPSAAPRRQNHAFIREPPPVIIILVKPEGQGCQIEQCRLAEANDMDQSINSDVERETASSTNIFMQSGTVQVVNLMMHELLASP
jgi:hypothetical protein